MENVLEILERPLDHWDAIPTALQSLRDGGMVLVMDDEDRENEGDLVLAAEFATQTNVAFMCRHSSGILCAPMSLDRAKRLQLPPMVESNTDRNATAFTVSIDLLEGTTTGASAIDRARTARRLADDDAKAEEFSRPGHLFPLVARDNGVFERTGHTEASVDLCKMAGLKDVAVIGELMHPNGDMMRLDACRAFASNHLIPIINVQQLIEFRRAAEKDERLLSMPSLTYPPLSQAKVHLTAESKLPVLLSGAEVPHMVTLRIYRSLQSDIEHVAIIHGAVCDKSSVWTRIHSECFTGDVLGSVRCDCGPQLRKSLEMLLAQSCGILVYVRDHEGRGIGLSQKANAALGLPSDLRNYDEANAILADLRVKSIVLLTSNPLKVHSLDVQVERVKALHTAFVNENIEYLEVKRQQARKLIPELMGDSIDLQTLADDLNVATTLSNHIHEEYMRRALKLALRGRASAPPNPWVGCVLVDKYGKIIGEGYHHRAGEPHAEIMALRDAVNRAAISSVANIDSPSVRRQAVGGATAYVTLEPCHHTGRTPPCDQALIEAGIKTVVIGVTDPDERVSSAGCEFLRSQGVQVIKGILESEIEEALMPYLHHRRTGLPFVILKTATTIDGKIACEDSTSQWITNDKARHHVHFLRAECQAILVGTGTALVDNPRLTSRINLDAVDDPELHSRYSETRAMPISRVVLDPKGKIVQGQLLDTATNPTIIFTSKLCPQLSRQLWDRNGVEVIDVDCVENERGNLLLDLTAVLTSLGKRGILQLLIEGGSAVHSSFLSANLVDALHVYVGSKLIGGSGLSWPSTTLATTISQAPKWSLAHVVALDGDLLAMYRQPKLNKQF